ncbi:MAG: anti-sigma factor family protein [Chlorobiales bacterium]
MTYDDYRYELPDFILGKSSPEVARALERLIETDAAFRAEFLEMKSQIEATAPQLNRAFELGSDAPPPVYFNALSKKVLERAVPKKATWWQTFKADIALFCKAPRVQWAGSMVGGVLALVLIIFVWQLDDNISQRRFAQDNHQQTPDLLIATNNFALGITPELIVAQIEAHEAEEVLNILEDKLLTTKQTYKVLTEDEAESLFKPM